MADIEKELRDRAEWRAANEGPFTKENLVEWRAADELSRLREEERKMLDAMEKAMDIYQDDAESDIGLAMFMTLYPFLEDKWKAPRALSERKEGQANG